jgi:hypothetical protein
MVLPRIGDILFLMIYNIVFFRIDHMVLPGIGNMIFHDL